MSASPSRTGWYTTSFQRTAALVLAPSESEAQAELVRVRQANTDMVAIVAGLPAGTFAANASAEDRFVAIARLTDPNKIGSAIVEILDSESGSWHPVEGSESFEAGLKLAFSGHTLYVGHPERGGCLVERLDAATSTRSSCWLDGSTIDEVDVAPTWTHSELMAVCDDEAVLALSAPNKSADFTLVAVTDGGEVRDLGRTLGDNPTFSCTSGGASVTAPGSAATIIPFSVPFGQ